MQVTRSGVILPQASSHLSPIRSMNAKRSSYPLHAPLIFPTPPRMMRGMACSKVLGLWIGYAVMQKYLDVTGGLATED